MLILPALSARRCLCTSYPLGKEVEAQTQVGMQVRSHIAVVMENLGISERGWPSTDATSLIAFLCGSHHIFSVGKSCPLLLPRLLNPACH